MTPQEEIKSIMLKHGISYSWIAERIGTYYQKIQYYVEFSKRDDNKLYNEIMLLFEKHGFIADSTAKCSTLIELNFKSNSKIGEELKKLNDQVLTDIKDGNFTPDERIRMRYRLEDIKKEFNATFDKLLQLTYGEVK